MAVIASPGRTKSSSYFLTGLLWRLLQLVLVLWIISTLLFFLIRLTGDPADFLAGANGTPESKERIRQAYGLSDPIVVQYARFIWNVTHLDFGNSIYSNLPAMQLILERLPATALLAFSALIVALLIAIPLGTIAAVNRGKFIDRFISVVVALGQSVPTFVFGLLLIFVFAVNLKWLPSFGQEGPQYLILPTIALSLGFIAQLTRLVRSNMLETLNQDYIRTARSKGLANAIVLSRHAFRNTWLTIITILGLNLSMLLGGSVVIEQLFSWPGMGAKILTAINNGDYPVIQAGVFIVALIVFTVNSLVDYLYQFADPRLRGK